MIEKVKEVKNINVKIARIKEIAFNSWELTEELISDISESTLAFGIGVRLIPIKELKEFGIAFSTTYSYNQGEKQKELCTYEMECVFNIVEFEEAVKYKGEQVNIEDGLLTNLLSITIGAARGMLALKTAGTVLNRFPLPIINPIDILQQLKNQAK